MFMVNVMNFPCGYCAGTPVLTMIFLFIFSVLLCFSQALRNTISSTLISIT